MSKTVYNKTNQKVEPYDDSSIKTRLTSLENRTDNDSQTLSFNSGTKELSISNGNNVVLPDISGANLFISKDDITGSGPKTIDKDTIYNGETIKVGDTVRDKYLYPKTGVLEHRYWKVISVTNTTVSVEHIGAERDIIVTKQGGINLLNKYCGYGYIVPQKKFSSYIVSQPYYFRDRMSLKQLGYSVGDNIKVSIDKLHSPLSSFNSNTRITVELYNENEGSDGKYITYITGQTLVGDMELKGEHVITDRTIDANSIRIRIDNFYDSSNKFVRFRNIMVYNSTRYYEDYIEPSGNEHTGHVNYLTNTRTLSNARTAKEKHYVNGFTYATGRSSRASVETYMQDLSIPIHTGWYTVRFKAKCNTGSVTILNRLINNDDAIKFTVNSQGSTSLLNDSETSIILDDVMRDYWISWYSSTSNPVTPTVMLGVISRTTMSADIEMGEFSFTDGCGLDSWVPSPFDATAVDPTTGLDALSKILRDMSTKGKWRKTGSTIFEGEVI